jgi:hypothetical protein
MSSCKEQGRRKRVRLEPLGRHKREHQVAKEINGASSSEGKDYGTDGVYLET